MMPAVGKLSNGKFSGKMPLAVSVRTQVAKVGNDGKANYSRGIVVINEVRFDVNFIHNYTLNYIGVVM